MPPRKVIIDTNFFLLPYQYKIDIFGELENLLEVHHQYIISTKTLKELEELAKNKGQKGAAAKLALKIIDMNKARLEVVSSGMYVDRWVAKHAVETGAIVCTNDKQLKNKLKENDIRVISLKGKKHLGFV